MKYVPLIGFLRRGPQPGRTRGWFVYSDRVSDDDVPAVILTGPGWLVRFVRRWF